MGYLFYYYYYIIIILVHIYSTKVPWKIEIETTNLQINTIFHLIRLHQLYYLFYFNSHRWPDNIIILIVGTYWIIINYLSAWCYIKKRPVVWDKSHDSTQKWEPQSIDNERWSGNNLQGDHQTIFSNR